MQTMGEEVGPVGNVKIGDPFDDGVFDGVRRVTVMTDNIGVVDIKVQYVAKEEFQTREHGYRNGGGGYFLLINYYIHFMYVFIVTSRD